LVRGPGVTTHTTTRKDDVQARIDNPALSVSGALEAFQKLGASAGESSERILTVAARRETPYLSGAERAALALTDAATRLADRPDPVPGDVSDDAARDCTERQLAALVAAINAFNRLNATTSQISGEWVGAAIQTAAHAA
jgi:hypothetical protein